ncbi:recombinase family protein [Vagococcus sp. BWB3-3]|uniref:Recombinase family protein n=1 Tax=Vagococcus allomyrinae TaxID=2794353 RepID=A0A940PAD7_9ENTE|nr:recombinase family protein [Vagococcus allomyrinae]MBP1044242.1 recombinase family protein [Vagococcus allomyrinae]
MAIIGYMRVSTIHQKFDSQQLALEQYGVETIYREYESGKKTNRNELNRALNSLQPGDTFVIFKLDRLARGTKHLLTLLDTFEQQGIHFVSIQNQIDTSTPMGKFFFTVMSAFAEMETELIRERVLAGLDAARDNGKTLGRPARTKEAEKAIDLYLHSNLTITEITAKCQISIPTLYNYLRLYQIPKKQKPSKRLMK